MGQFRCIFFTHILVCKRRVLRTKIRMQKTPCEPSLNLQVSIYMALITYLPGRGHILFSSEHLVNLSTLYFHQGRISSVIPTWDERKKLSFQKIRSMPIRQSSPHVHNCGSSLLFACTMPVPHVHKDQHVHFFMFFRCSRTHPAFSKKIVTRHISHFIYIYITQSWPLSSPLYHLHYINITDSMSPGHQMLISVMVYRLGLKPAIHIRCGCSAWEEGGKLLPDSSSGSLSPPE